MRGTLSKNAGGRDQVGELRNTRVGLPNGVAVFIGGRDVGMNCFGDACVEGCVGND